MPLTLYPGIDLGYRPNEHWQLYASYNSSLRMPSFTELYYAVGGHKADKHLRPEKLAAFETGVKYKSQWLRAQTNFFFNRHSDLIDWISDGSTDADGALLWQSVNFGRIHTLGLQAQAELNLQALFPSQHIVQRMEVAYTYLHQKEHRPEGIVSKYALEYLRHKLVASLHLNPWKKLETSFYLRYHDRRGAYYNLDKQLTTYKPYALLDLRLQWREAHWIFTFDANNLLNTNYIDYGNVPQPGFWCKAGVAYSF